ncbi:MAG: hypothetical protein Q9157_008207 [Trypethelium eluteriae]
MDFQILRQQLHRKRIEAPQRSGQHFIPRCAQEKLITKDVFMDVIRAEYLDLPDSDVAIFVHERFPIARRLFAILAYIQRLEQLRRFLDGNITDKRLPLRRSSEDLDGEDTSSEWVLEARGEDGRERIHVGALDSWSSDDREEFSHAQRLMTSPFFKRSESYSLDDDEVLPFLYPRPKIEDRRGGYSEIRIRRPYPSHHNFWDRSDDPNVCLYQTPASNYSNAMQDERLVAIKMLYSNDEKEVNNEIENLQKIGGKHDHLIQLFACYKYQGKMYLILPYAESDLRTYWLKRATPAFDRRTAFWSLTQLYGIADGLLKVHNFTPTWPLEPDGGLRMPDEDATLSIQPDEKNYGRHGDLKPENILYFPNELNNESRDDILKITDYGLSRFHGRESRSRSNQNNVAYSPTYEPPEIRLGIPVSRKYDIWSLGCVYLEFVTWLLKGNEGIKVFSRERLGAHPTIPKLSEDIFFTMIRSGDEADAEVRAAVVEWVKDLHEHECCSDLIHDLLKLIMKGMLRIKPEARIEARQLRDNLKDLLDKAKTDNQYLLAPTPLSPRSTPNPRKPSLVHWADQGRSGSRST